MKYTFKVAAIGLAALVLGMPLAAQPRGRAVVVVVPPVVVYDPFWFPYGVYGGYHAPVTGTLKIGTDVKGADVFINGARAGTVTKVKTLHLMPGTYGIEVRAPGRTSYAEEVYIVAGKTFHLHPDLRVAAAIVKPTS